MNDHEYDNSQFSQRTSCVYEYQYVSAINLRTNAYTQFCSITHALHYQTSYTSTAEPSKQATLLSSFSPPASSVNALSGHTHPVIARVRLQSDVQSAFGYNAGTAFGSSIPGLSSARVSVLSCPCSGAGGGAD